MSKYEHRIDKLKEHKQDKERKYHHTHYKSNKNKRKLKYQKKAFKDFHKKLDKSQKIW